MPDILDKHLTTPAQSPQTPFDIYAQAWKARKQREASAAAKPAPVPKPVAPAGPSLGETIIGKAAAIPQGFAEGTMATGTALRGLVRIGADILGAEGLSNEMQMQEAAGQKALSELPTNTPVAKDSWIVRGVGNGFGQLLPMIAAPEAYAGRAITAAEKAAEAVTAATQGGKSVVEIAQGLSNLATATKRADDMVKKGIVLGTALGGVEQGTETYETVKDAGGSVAASLAAGAATGTFAALTTRFELDKVFPKLEAATQGRLARMAMLAATEGTQESSQELLNAVTEAVALQAPDRLNDSFNRALSAATPATIVGALLGIRKAPHVNPPNLPTAEDPIPEKRAVVEARVQADKAKWAVSGSDFEPDTRTPLERGDVGLTEGQRDPSLPNPGAGTLTPEGPTYGTGRRPTEFDAPTYGPRRPSFFNPARTQPTDLEAGRTQSGDARLPGTLTPVGPDYGPKIPRQASTFAPGAPQTNLESGVPLGGDSGQPSTLMPEGPAYGPVAPRQENAFWPTQLPTPLESGTPLSGDSGWPSALEPAGQTTYGPRKPSFFDPAKQRKDSPIETGRTLEGDSRRKTVFGDTAQPQAVDTQGGTQPQQDVGKIPWHQPVAPAREVSGDVLEHLEKVVDNDLATVQGETGKLRSARAATNANWDNAKMGRRNAVTDHIVLSVDDLAAMHNNSGDFGALNAAIYDEGGGPRLVEDLAAKYLGVDPSRVILMRRGVRKNRSSNPERPSDVNDGLGEGIGARPKTSSGEDIKVKGKNRIYDSFDQEQDPFIFQIKKAPEGADAPAIARLKSILGALRTAPQGSPLAEVGELMAASVANPNDFDLEAKAKNAWKKAGLPVRMLGQKPTMRAFAALHDALSDSPFLPESLLGGEAQANAQASNAQDHAWVQQVAREIAGLTARLGSATNPQEIKSLTEQLQVLHNDISGVNPWYKFRHLANLPEPPIPIHGDGDTIVTQELPTKQVADPLTGELKTSNKFYHEMTQEEQASHIEHDFDAEPLFQKRAPKAGHAAMLKKFWKSSGIRKNPLVEQAVQTLVGKGASSPISVQEVTAIILKSNGLALDFHVDNKEGVVTLVPLDDDPVSHRVLAENNANITNQIEAGYMAALGNAKLPKVLRVQDFPEMSANQLLQRFKKDPWVGDNGILRKELEAAKGEILKARNADRSGAGHQPILDLTQEQVDEVLHLAYTFAESWGATNNQPASAWFEQAFLNTLGSPDYRNVMGVVYNDTATGRSLGNLPPRESTYNQTANERDSVPMPNMVVQGQNLQTGSPVDLPVLASTEPKTVSTHAPVQPPGRYLMDGSGDLAPENVHFENPLVVAFNKTGRADYAEGSNWKLRLPSMFGGKTGEELSHAIAASGHDGIVVVQTDPSGKGKRIREIVDLAEYVRQVPAPSPIEELANGPTPPVQGTLFSKGTQAPLQLVTPGTEADVATLLAYNVPSAQLVERSPAWLQAEAAKVRESGQQPLALRELPNAVQALKSGAQSVADVEAAMRSANGINDLYSKNQGTTLGFIEWFQGMHGLINLTSHANVETVVHEMAHVFRAYMPDAEVDRLARWCGAIPDEIDGLNGWKWTKDAEEKFVSTLLTIVRNPSKRIAAPKNVQGVFANLQTWFQTVDTIWSKDTSITPASIPGDVRQAFHHMFMVPDEVVWGNALAKQADRNFATVIQTASGTAALNPKMLGLKSADQLLTLASINEVIESARQTIPLTQLKAEADAIAKDPAKQADIETIISLGGVLNASQSLYFRDMLLATTERLTEQLNLQGLTGTKLQDEIRSMSPEELPSIYIKAAKNHEATGRALYSLGVRLAMENAMQAKFNIGRMLNPTEQYRYNQAMKLLEAGNPEGIAAMSRLQADTKSPTLRAYMQQIMFNGMLSGFTSQANNVFNNALRLAWLGAVHTPLTALVDAGMSMVRPGYRRTKWLGETGAYFRGARKGFKRAFETPGGEIHNPVKHIWKTGEHPVGVDAVDRYEFDLISRDQLALEHTPDTFKLFGIGPEVSWGKFIRDHAVWVSWPTRVMRMADFIAQRTAEGAALQQWAYREASNLYAAGTDAWNKHYQDLLDNPSGDAREQAMLFARYVSFNDAPGEFTQGAIKIKNSLGVASPFVLPFINTIANISKRSLEHVPVLGFGMEAISARNIRVKKDALGQPVLGPDGTPITSPNAFREALAGQIAKQIEGAALLFLLFSMFDREEEDGFPVITGKMPEDKAEREAWARKGVLPYSVKVGQRYVQYSQLDPCATLLMYAGELYSRYKDWKDGKYLSQEDPTAALMAEGVKNIWGVTLDKSFLDSTAQILDPQEKFYSAWSQRLTVMVPYSGALRSVASVADMALSGSSLPERRDAGLVMGAFIKVIPGLGSQFPARLDVWGKPQTVSTASLLNAWMPIRSSGVTGDIVEDELARLRFYPGLPLPNQVTTLVEGSNEQFRVPDDLYRSFLVSYGTRAKETLNKLFTSETYLSKDMSNPKVVQQAITGIDSRLSHIRSQELMHLRREMRKLVRTGDLMPIPKAVPTRSPGQAQPQGQASRSPS